VEREEERARVAKERRESEEKLRVEREEERARVIRQKIKGGKRLPFMSI
jgi:hypothetical protein